MFIIFVFRTFGYGIATLLVIGGSYMLYIPPIYGDVYKAPIALGMLQIAVGITMFFISSLRKSSTTSDDLLWQFSVKSVESKKFYRALVIAYALSIFLASITQYSADMSYTNETWNVLENRLTEQELCMTKVLPKFMKQDIWTVCKIYERAGIDASKDQDSYTEEEQAQLDESFKEFEFDSKSQLIFWYIVHAGLCGSLCCNLMTRKTYLIIKRNELAAIEKRRQLL